MLILNEAIICMIVCLHHHLTETNDGSFACADFRMFLLS